MDGNNLWYIIKCDDSTCCCWSKRLFLCCHVCLYIYTLVHKLIPYLYFSVLSNTLWHLLLSSIEDLKNPFIRLRVKTWNNVAPFHIIQWYLIVIRKIWGRATNYSIVIKYKNTKWYVLVQHFFNWCKQWNEQEKDERDWFENFSTYK